MKITLIAFTALAYSEFERNVHEPWSQCYFQTPVKCTYADLLAELAGRNCYQSWNRPNPRTERNADYLRNILEQGHFSVLEHASASFLVEGVSRSLLTELNTHRHLSRSVLSQRYVDEFNRTDPVVPPAIRGDGAAEEIVREAVRYAQDSYRVLVDILESKGLPRKEAREAARSVLPNATETKMVISGNHRAWRDMLFKRYHVAADAEIREFATGILSIMRRIAPNTYQDFPIRPFGSERKDISEA